jgi:hypothetical protein
MGLMVYGLTWLPTTDRYLSAWAVLAQVEDQIVHPATPETKRLIGGALYYDTGFPFSNEKKYAAISWMLRLARTLE